MVSLHLAFAREPAPVTIQSRVETHQGDGLNFSASIRIVFKMAF